MLLLFTLSLTEQDKQIEIKMFIYNNHKKNKRSNKNKPLVIIMVFRGRRIGWMTTTGKQQISPAS